MNKHKLIQSLQTHGCHNQGFPRGGVDTLEPLKGIQFVASMSRRKFPSWVCFAGGPRPRNPRVWKTRTKIGSVSKSEKLVEHVKHYPMSRKKYVVL